MSLPDLAGRRHPGRVRRPAAAQRRRRAPAVGAARDRRGAHRLRPARAWVRRTPTRRTSPGSTAVASAIPGIDPFDLAVAAAGRGRRARPGDRRSRCQLRRHARRGRPPSTPSTPRSRSPASTSRGIATGRPVSELLGGRVRDRVPFSGYLFYKWAGHPGFPDDAWGEALTPDAARRAGAPDGRRLGLRLAQAQGRGLPARRRSATRSRRCATPSPTCRCGSTPTAPGRRRPRSRSRPGWRASSSTSRTRRPASRAWPTVAAGTDVPLATNMCVIAIEHLPPAIASDAVQIVLSDHHLWGGLRRSQLLAGIAETWGLGLSMHSNSHLGVSLAAMTHLAAATPTLTYACDTHYPWKTQDVIKPGRAVLRRRRPVGARRPRASASSSTATCSGCCTSST